MLSLQDVDVVDNTLPQNLRSWINTLASFLGTVILIIVKIPYFAAVIVPVGVVFFFVQNIYVNTSRQLKRLESISRYGWRCAYNVSTVLYCTYTVP